MRSRGWRAYSVAAMLVLIQVGVPAIGAAGMCLDRPHTHGGVPAPDCSMHTSEGATAPDASKHSHHSHDDSAPADGARLACSVHPIRSRSSRLKSPSFRLASPSGSRI